MDSATADNLADKLVLRDGNGHFKSHSITLTNSIVIGNASVGVTGAIRWSGLDYEGYVSGDWVSLTSNGTSSSGEQSSEEQSADLGIYFTWGGHFIPLVDNTYDLGSTTKVWKDVYLKSLYVNNKQIISDTESTTIISTTDNHNLKIKAGGTGLLQLESTNDMTLTASSGNIELKGTV